MRNFSEKKNIDCKPLGFLAKQIIFMQSCDYSCNWLWCALTSFSDYFLAKCWDLGELPDSIIQVLSEW